MRLFIRLDDVYNLGLVVDRVFRTRILTLVSGSWEIAYGRVAPGLSVSFNY